ncbi:S-methyl-5'-thioadenosine phosphorylase [Nocardia brasiliensis NBRC 14402]|uniref:S-methyl-5'-thioadenosine phosphorylase n=1 Tax=Nocardia brasiliensis TaxID=37326 RepID=UPI0002E71A7E|nr:S-methyl-5'-thioadenosine phosphorylase [Nocardia brasiliensis]ASF07332.1 S-methyl-5'-thioadenosine phosphorylase [Nocardia brasiliensis]GAJ86111.1 S-methyl-5'-thioadenosine phosphorylase [Nocardia brasiliensis NBRC 14402]SUB47363.1 S-methyl-5'-thioadenosine phosphorylase [Nocardia brasiliensis]
MVAPTAEIELGIIGGSGLYDLETLADRREVALTTPYGDPSDQVGVGVLDGRPIAFLARHGRGHRYLPTEVPAAANIHALKQLGVQRILSISAVGSLRNEIEPSHLVVPDQLVDLTRHRRSTFFGAGLVAHVPLGDPFCPVLRAGLTDVAASAGATVHRAGTYVCIEGPQFSTRAESELYRAWGADIIGMTAATEVKLAREAGICFATLALVTDYDCWRTGGPSVTADMVASVMRANIATAKDIIRKFAASSDGTARDCECADAMRHAVMSDPAGVPGDTADRLALIAGNQLR